MAKANRNEIEKMRNANERNSEVKITKELLIYDVQSYGKTIEYTPMYKNASKAFEESKGDCVMWKIDQSSGTKSVLMRKKAPVQVATLPRVVVEKVKAELRI
jgi:hypothetical protein